VLSLSSRKVILRRATASGLQHSVCWFGATPWNSLSFSDMSLLPLL